MEKINFNITRNLSEIISASIQFIKSEGKTLLKFYSRFLLPLFIPVTILTYQSDLFAIGEVINEDVSQLESLLSTFDLKGILLAMLAQAFTWLVFLSITLVYLRNYCTNNNKVLSVRDMWSQILYEFPKLFIVQFFYLSMVVFGLFSFVIPGIYFGVSLALTATIVVFEDSKIFRAMSTSLKLTRLKWFMSLGYLLVFYLLYIIARTLLQLPITFIGTSISESGELSRMGFTVISTLNAIINMLASIFPILGSVFLYHKLNQERDL